MPVGARRAASSSYSDTFTLFCLLRWRCGGGRALRSAEGQQHELGEPDVQAGDDGTMITTKMITTIE